MALAEYLIEVDQDLWLTFLMDDATDWSNPVSPPTAVAAPVLTSLAPDTAQVGDPQFTMDLVGTGFTEISRVLWNGGIEDSVFVGATRLRMQVDPGTASGPYTIPVAVLNGSQSSAEVDFTFTEGAE
jgi:hypothetical protein